MFELLYIAFILLYLVVTRLLSWLLLWLARGWPTTPQLVAAVHLVTLAIITVPAYLYHRDTGLGFWPAFLGFLLPPWLLCLIFDLVRRARVGR